jgi:hypothetical protein
MKNLKYNLTINNTSEIIENVNMSELIQHINKTLENNNYPVELFKINNQTIYNLQNNRPCNKHLKKLFSINKRIST